MGICGELYEHLAERQPAKLKQGARTKDREHYLCLRLICGGITPKRRCRGPEDFGKFGAGTRTKKAALEGDEAQPFPRPVGTDGGRRVRSQG